MFANGARGFSVIVPAAVLLAEGRLFRHFLQHGG